MGLSLRYKSFYIYINGGNILCSKNNCSTLYSITQSFANCLVSELFSATAALKNKRSIRITFNARTAWRRAQCYFHETENMCQKSQHTGRRSPGELKIVQRPITAGIFTDDLTPLTFVLQRVSMALPFRNQQWKLKGAVGGWEIKERREKLARDLSEISCPDICMWSLTAGFKGERMGFTEAEGNVKVRQSFLL